MAEVAFLKIVLDNLSSLIRAEIGLIMGVDKEMKKLSSTLSAIQAVLADAEEKQCKNNAIADWLRKLNDLAHEIDDILDECSTEASMQRLNGNSCASFSLKNAFFKHRIGKRMKEVSEKLDQVNAERENLHLHEMFSPMMQHDPDTFKRETGSILNDAHHILGREHEKEEIIEILLRQTKDHQDLVVLPIVGIGGLGKTTLAQLVFNDSRIVDHFEKRLWAYVSDNFDLKNLVKAIIESAAKNGSASDLTNLNALQLQLQDLLRNQRFLLVLDDVWNDDQEKWAKLKDVIACGSKGSSVLVTTRLPKVARIMQTLPYLQLRGLSDDECWLLLKDRAFGREEEQDPNLVAIGKEIVKKCNGVPLAAKALGGVLRFKREEKEWLCVKESEILNLPLEKDPILPALKLSYSSLPLELRQCFAYCAVFPRGCEINKEELIRLWMAHGYVLSSGKLELEDVGNQIWKELVLRSLFQDVHTNVYGETIFTMHDLIHDLAQLVLENKGTGTPVAGGQSTSNNKVRQVNLRQHSQMFLSLSSFPSCLQDELHLSFALTNFKRLRVLDASYVHIGVLPYDIGHMKHLRYLNLAGTYIYYLPDSICDLRNLQSLVLIQCQNLWCLPKCLRYLRSLRHLLLHNCPLGHMPPKLGELICLTTLDEFTVGWGGRSQLCELKFLSLGGKLKIKHLERVENHADAREANLKEKPDLSELILKWNIENVLKSQENIDGKVLECLEPHPNLRTLEINGFRGLNFPLWMSNALLKNVIKIELANCPNCVCPPQLGELPLLKILILRYLGVTYIIDNELEGEDTAISFPFLQKLQLSYLPHLKGLSRKETRRMFESLECLELDECPLLTLPPIPSLKEVKARYCSSLTLSSFSRLEMVTSLVLNEDGEMTYIPCETTDPKLGY